MSLGGGVALRVASDDLSAIRSEIASRLHGLLTAQDAASWSAHVTIQNKVPARDAKAFAAAAATRQWQREPMVRTLA